MECRIFLEQPRNYYVYKELGYWFVCWLVGWLVGLLVAWLLGNSVIR